MLPPVLMELMKGKTGCRKVEPVSGGCINHAFKLSGKHGAVFLKYNNSKTYPGMFAAEAQSLTLLAATQTVKVPEVIETGDCEEFTYLLLEYVPPQPPGHHSMQYLGRQLAMLHLATFENFGLPFNNYIGALPQNNQPYQSWAAFYQQQRLQPLLTAALEKGLLTSADQKAFDALYIKLDELIPDVKPSLLHGDLWGGNYLIGHGGEPYLIDPAIYYGHREVDIAMTRLFGGFDDDFYKGYEEVYPLQEDWQHRTALYQLYPLLVHVNLFGSSYAGQLRATLQRYL